MQMYKNVHFDKVILTVFLPVFSYCIKQITNMKMYQHCKQSNCTHAETHYKPNGGEDPLKTQLSPLSVAQEQPTVGVHASLQERRGVKLKERRDV